MSQDSFIMHHWHMRVPCSRVDTFSISIKFSVKHQLSVVHTLHRFIKIIFCRSQGSKLDGHREYKWTVQRTSSAGSFDDNQRVYRYNRRISVEYRHSHVRPKSIQTCYIENYCHTCHHQVSPLDNRICTCTFFLHHTLFCVLCLLSDKVSIRLLKL